MTKKLDAKISERLEKLTVLEKELLRKTQKTVSAGNPITVCDLFVMGAMKRVLSNSSGFQLLIKDRNFSSCAALLRMQIDTAMRLNGLTLLEDRETSIQSILLEDNQFNKLKDVDGKRLQDFYLADKLTEKHPWIKEVYKQTCDFVHLSGREFFNTIAKIDDDGVVLMHISAEDPYRHDGQYDEIIDAFYEATKLASMLVLAYFTSKTMLPESQ